MKRKSGKNFLCLLGTAMAIFFGISVLTYAGAGNVWADEPCKAIVSSNASAETPTDGDGGGACAAVYLLGEDDPRLDTLRQFRDDVLAKNTTGEKLIEIYYETGEGAIAILDKNPTLKKSATKVLETIVPATVSSNASAETPTDGDGGGACAAAYLLGDDDPRLDTLRQFRDDVLAKSTIGNKLIAAYYNNGEKIIAILDKNPIIKKSAKKILGLLVK